MSDAGVREKRDAHDRNQRYGDSRLRILLQYEYFCQFLQNGVIGELFQLLIVTHVPEEDIAIARVFRLGNNFLDGIRRC